MISYVSLQGTGLSKTFLTILTVVGFFFGVSSDVNLQSTPSYETFCTILTLVWFLFGVSPGCELSGHLSVRTFSGNSRTDMVSLWCEF